MKRRIKTFPKLILAILLIAPILTLVSCEKTVIDRKVKIFYQNGTSEVMTISNRSEVSGREKPVLYNGCLYRRKRIGATMWSEDDYIDCLRCGVKYYKTLSVTTRPYEKK